MALLDLNVNFIYLVSYIPELMFVKRLLLLTDENQKSLMIYIKLMVI